MHAQAYALVEEFKRIRDALVGEFPELDEETLIDTVDGEAQLLDFVAALLRGEREDRATSAALGDLIAEYKERQDRLDGRAQKRREAALRLLNEAGVQKFTRPEFTVTISAGRPKVLIQDEGALPDEFLVTKKSPDKAKIKSALEAGEAVPGAMLSNAEPVLTVRTK